jgi:hypothetical protein
MLNTYKHTYKNKNFTRKNIKINSFQKEVTCKFLEILLMVKLYHWKTHSYATHKATDQLYDDLNDHHALKLFYRAVTRSLSQKRNT